MALFCEHGNELTRELGIASCPKCWKAYVDAFVAGIKYPWLRVSPAPELTEVIEG